MTPLPNAGWREWQSGPKGIFTRWTLSKLMESHFGCKKKGRSSAPALFPRERGHLARNGRPARKLDWFSHPPENLFTRRTLLAIRNMLDPGDSGRDALAALFPRERGHLARNGRPARKLDWSSHPPENIFTRRTLLATRNRLDPGDSGRDALAAETAALPARGSRQGAPRKLP
jgi:hypothetical protein